MNEELEHDRASNRGRKPEPPVVQLLEARSRRAALPRAWFAAVDPLYLVRLLAVTDMRISEALHLKAHDIDWDAGVLTVRHTNFGKIRIGSLHPSTIKVLADYARRRDRFLKGSSQPSSGNFFISNMGVLHSAF